MGQLTMPTQGEKSEGAQPAFQPSVLRLPRLQTHSRAYMAALLLAADALSLLLAGMAAVGLRYLMGNLLNPPFYWTLVPFILIFLVVYALRGLYPAIGLSPVEELRLLSTTTSVVFLILTAFTFWARTAELYSRLVFAFAWVFALVSVPVGRMILRVLASRLKLWGEPVAVIGSNHQALRMVQYLQSRIRLGLRPVVIIDPLEDQGGEAPVPSLALNQENGFGGQLAGIQTAILVLSDLSEAQQRATVAHPALRFRRLILITDLSWTGSLGLTPYDLEGLLGLEVRQNLLNPLQQYFKRLLDILVSMTLAVITFPLVVMIAMLIRLDSPGGLLYGHTRLGKGGRPITVWKFRTMVRDADAVLQARLEADAGLKAEWQMTQKLRHDPRVTRVGAFLRRTSLDELPQLWNVLRGEMSLVGPRPIVQAEVEHYREGYELYRQVRPGMTGLWQVSGRTDTSYPERVRYDEYYIRNWSLWLDLYILLRTAWVVLRGEGAY